MTESLDQILELIKKTGDRCVVIDRATKNNYVVMSIKDYEHLVFANKEKAEIQKVKLDAQPIKVAAIKEEVEQSTIPLDSLPTQESAVPDWWSEKAEKSQPLDEKQADDQYYLEPVES